MKRFACSLVATCLLAGCASSGPVKETTPEPSETKASSGAAVPLAGTLKVRRFQLENGLKLLVIENHSSPTFAYQTWFSVGSRDEVPTRTGLAHLFEHMMFKGTKNQAEGSFTHKLEEAGSQDTNAYTTRDYTVYIQELPKDQLELIMQLESDRMVNLIVNDAAFKTEREVVQNERRMRTENNPDGMLYQEIYALAFNTHSYRWPVIGYEQDLAAMSSADAEAFYKAYYSPNHATVVVVGDVDPDQVHSMVKKYYGSLPRRDAPGHDIPAEPPQATFRRKTLPLNVQNEKLVMGFQMPAFSEIDSPIADVVGKLLTGGKSSRLHRALVETGIASGIDAGGGDAKDPTLFLISASLQKGKKAALAEAAINRELASLSRELVPSKELDRVKNQLSFQFYEGLGGNDDIARFVGHYETIGKDFEAGMRAFKRSLAVTPEEVRTFLKAHLDPSKRTVVLGVPK